MNEYSLAKVQYSSFSDYCEETALLDNVQPSQLKIVVRNAELTLSEMQWSNNQSLSLGTKTIHSKKEILRKQQLQSVVDRINIYNEQRGKLWRAGITNLSLQSFDVKKRMLGITDNDCSEGLEYYAGGIIDLGHYDANTVIQMRSSVAYVENFDWRNRHGKNWLTPVKDQGCSNYCVAFSTVACTEAMLNLYYNKITNVILSEQEVASCAEGDSTYFKGMHADTVLTYLKSHGVCDSISYPFVDLPFQPCRSDSITPNELVKINGYHNNGCYFSNIKNALINKGPLVSGYYLGSGGGHSMLMVGYGTVHSGDTLQIFWNDNFSNNYYIVPDNNPYEGWIYFIFKNSWGTNWYGSHDGYMYILFNNLDYLSYPYSELYPFTTMNFSDADIVCEDADGDGYYFWGLGPKPAHCPAWAPDTPDGDDSNINYGPMDEYGHLEILPTGITIRTPVVYNNNVNLDYHIGIVNGGTLTITGTTNMTNNGKIRVCENGILIVDGGCIQDANLELIPGSKLIVRNGGVINLSSNRFFEAPVGTIVEIESGAIQ